MFFGILLGRINYKNILMITETIIFNHGVIWMLSESNKSFLKNYCNCVNICMVIVKCMVFLFVTVAFSQAKQVEAEIFVLSNSYFFLIYLFLLKLY